MRNNSCDAPGANGSADKPTGENLKARTQALALRVIRLVESLPRGRTADVIGKQLLRSATSVGANYRAACRARSPAEFIAKMGTVEEEADESSYWLELLVRAGLVDQQRLAKLMQETNELTAIAVTSITTARKRKR